MNISYTHHRLDNGLDVLIHEDHACPIVAVNVWYHVGSKNETPGRTGFAHLFEHLMFEGSEHYDHGYFHPLQEAGRAAERVDQRRPHQLLGGRAAQRARAGAVDGIRSHGLPAARADRREVREPARRRAERAPAELREPAVWLRRHGDRRGACTRRPSLSLADDRQRGGHPRRAPRRRPGVLPDLLPSAERVARARGRRRHGSRSSPWRPITSARSTAATSLPRSCSRRRRSDDLARCGCCSRTASSCRGCTWRGTRPALFAPDDAELDLVAELLASGKTSRLYRTLVYEAADRHRDRGVAELARDWRLLPGRGHGRAGADAARARARDRQELVLVRRAGSDRRSRWSAARRRRKRNFVYRLQTVGGFGGKSDQLNAYNVFLERSRVLRTRSRSLPRR